MQLLTPTQAVAQLQHTEAVVCVYTLVYSMCRNRLFLESCVYLLREEVFIACSVSNVTRDDSIAFSINCNACHTVVVKSVHVPSSSRVYAVQRTMQLLLQLTHPTLTARTASSVLLVRIVLKLAMQTVHFYSNYASCVMKS
jgi:hypothetical protein